jgi:hypothetical protein
VVGKGLIRAGGSLLDYEIVTTIRQVIPDGIFQRYLMTGCLARCLSNAK